MMKEYIVRKSVLSIDEENTLSPIRHILRNDSIFIHDVGNHPPVAHSIPVFIPANATDCHTSAHAPYPANARAMPRSPPPVCATRFDTAIIFTSIRFMRRLVCTIARALSTKVRNITFDNGINLRSCWNISAINGAANHSIQYIPTLTMRLNQNTVE